MKKIISFFLLIGFLAFSGFAQEKNNFVSLFNGKNLDHWILGEEGGFEIREGVIYTSSYKKGSELFTEKKYANYILRLEYMLSEFGNSGILIRCDTANAWTTGVEIQLLYPMTPPRDSLHCTGSIYGHVPVTNRPDETSLTWHSMEVICDRSLITISIDDQMITNVDVDTLESMQDKWISGFIGLQVNHATKEKQFAKFRELYLRDMDLEPEYVLEGFGEPAAKFRKQAHEAALSIGPPMIEPLAVLMSWGDPMERSGAKQILFDITAQASSPESSKKKKGEVASALKVSVEKTTSDITREYLEWLLGMIE